MFASPLLIKSSYLADLNMDLTGQPNFMQRCEDDISDAVLMTKKLEIVSCSATAGQWARQQSSFSVSTTSDGPFLDRTDNSASDGA